MKITTLVLKYEPFDVMITGEKPNEFRRQSNWIKSRLYDKQGAIKVTHIKFVRGFTKNANWFIVPVKYILLKQIGKNINIKYSTGFNLTIEAGKLFYEINLQPSKIITKEQIELKYFDGLINTDITEFDYKTFVEQCFK